MASLINRSTIIFIIRLLLLYIVMKGFIHIEVGELHLHTDWTSEQTGVVLVLLIILSLLLAILFLTVCGTVTCIFRYFRRWLAMATGQASTKPPDANEYGGGMPQIIHLSLQHVCTNSITQMRYQPWSLTPVTPQLELASREKMFPNRSYRPTMALSPPNPNTNMPRNSLAIIR